MRSVHDEFAWMLLLGTEGQIRIHDSYQGAVAPVSEHDSRWRRDLAAGLLALARWMAPVEYADRLTPAASPVLATG